MYDDKVLHNQKAETPTLTLISTCICQCCRLAWIQTGGGLPQWVLTLALFT